MALADHMDIPAEYSSMMVDSPHTTQAPERKSTWRKMNQPLTPAMSARHISPETPPTKDRKITNQIGISTNACCSLFIESPKCKNPGTKAGVFSVWRAALCARTSRRWVHFAGRVSWQQAGFNATRQ